MKEYIQQINGLVTPSFPQIRQIAKENCGCVCNGNIYNCKPWTDLDHGVALLDTHEKLCKYLCAYGEMHEEKMKTALSSIYNPQHVFDNSFSIIDWGCGQGLATVCFFDFLNDKKIWNGVQEVILIEPSLMALYIAKLHVNTYIRNECKIQSINKYLDDVVKSDIKTNQPVTLHFFSNILDIPQIDLSRLAKLVHENVNGEHYFFCVGPMNCSSTRIEEFAQCLNIEKEQIIKQYQGSLSNIRGTVKLLVFKLSGKEIEVIKTDFYPPSPNNINYILMINKILSKVSPGSLNSMDKIIQFYKTVTELEQQKEPDIREFFPYPINTFSLDLRKNKDFCNAFEINKTVKWPKDLFIGLKATLNDKSYMLLHYIIPFDDMKDLNTNTQQIPCNLSKFSVYPKSFEELELSEEQISEIEDAIKQQSSINGILSVLKSKIDGSITLDDNLHLALSQKNPALSQIYSELNKLNSTQILQDSLLKSFLMNQNIDNCVNELEEEDLIQISDIDDSQKKAVLSAFNNKLSVITGPPGSGKTQVILNILANAALQNKKVLVASKNNKAVDNVKDRFDKIDNLKSFLRFGSKGVLSEKTIPAIQTIIDTIPNLKNNEQDIINLRNQINTQKQILIENKACLAKRDELLKNLPEIESNISRSEMKITQLQKDFAQDKESLLANNRDIDFFKQLFDIRILDEFNSSLKVRKKKLEYKYSGLRKIWFNWFSKQKYAKEILDIIEQYPFEIRNYIQTRNRKTQLSEFKKGDDIIELYRNIITIFSDAINYIQHYVRLEDNYNSDMVKFSTERNNLTEKRVECNRIISEITNNESAILQNIEQSKRKIEKLGKPLLVESIKYKLKISSRPNINNYKDYLPDNIPWRDDGVRGFINSTSAFLDIFNIVSVTSLSAKAAFPLTNELFDMVVIDEASQCDIASAIPLIFRTKQLVVIGDPLQLKHISMVNDYEETYIKEHLFLNNCPFLHYNRKSLWDYCKDLLALAYRNNIPIMLDRHYRCHPHIIGYSNETFYGKILGNRLTIRTNDADYSLQPKGIVWINVQGRQRANNININDLEIEKSIEIATELAFRHPDISIGIVTPFRAQAEELHRGIPTQYRDRIVADTVHKFQGDEKDVMIYSLVVTDNSPSSKIRWIDISVPNLVNVAVTRAKNTLYIAGNKEYIRRNSSLTNPLGKLVEYVERTQRSVKQCKTTGAYS
jgi:RecA/RadA recombinase